MTIFKIYIIKYHSKRLQIYIENDFTLCYNFNTAI